MAVVDLHTHTSHSSGCSRMTAEELIEAAIAAGLDGVAVTEHWVMEGADLAQDLALRRYKLPVFRGIEVQTAGMGDVLVYGCYRDFPPKFPWGELRRIVLEAGGVLIPAHPFRRRDPNSAWSQLEAYQRALQSGRSPDGLLSEVAAFEVLNGGNEPGENVEAASLAASLGLPASGGSDAHWIERVGTMATWFPGRITTDAELVAALKAGAFRGVDRRSTNYESNKRMGGW